MLDAGFLDEFEEEMVAVCVEGTRPPVVDSQTSVHIGMNNSKEIKKFDQHSATVLECLSNFCDGHECVNICNVANPIHSRVAI